MHACMHHLSSVYLSCQGESSTITNVLSIEKHMWWLRLGGLRETQIFLRLYKQLDYFFFVFSFFLSFFCFLFFFFSAREILVPKGLDTTTTTIMELTK